LKVVVDEGVPRAIVKSLSSFGVDTHHFPQEWRGLSNGRLIGGAEKAGYACLLTNDRNMASQTNLRGRQIFVVALPSNKAKAIVDRARDIADTILQSSPGQHVVLDMDGKRSVHQNFQSAGAGAAAELPRIPPFKTG
jgi:predicted nuclease of predicted toxin-antitoxin system